MTKHWKKPDDTARTDIFAQAIEAQRRFAAMAWHFNATLLSESAALNTEVMDFIQRRIGEDINTCSALGHCESFNQAIETLTEFQQKALEDYTTETAKLSALNTRAKDAVVAEVSKDTEIVVDEMRQRAA